jgi:hypothetical protein
MSADEWSGGNLLRSTLSESKEHYIGLIRFLDQREKEIYFYGKNK